jgi:hypothetical protein
VPTSSFLFFVLPQRKETKESGTLANSSAGQSSYTACNPDSADTAIADQLLIYQVLCGEARGFLLIDD